MNFPIFSISIFDAYERSMVMTDESIIPLDSILEMESELFLYL